MRKKAFDIQEAVVLLDVYLGIVKKGQLISEAAKTASCRLRELAKKNGYHIDDSFRSPCGLYQRIRCLAGVFEGIKSVSSPATVIFKQVVFLYNYNREKYETILLSASSNETIDSGCSTTKEFGKERGLKMEKDINAENNFFQWIYSNSLTEYKELTILYNKINLLLMKSKVLDRSLAEVTSTNDIDKVIEQLKRIFVNKIMRSNASRLLLTYKLYLRSKEQKSMGLDASDTKNTVSTQNEKKDREELTETKNDLQEKVEQYVMEADLNGITIEQLSKSIPEATITSLKQIRDSSKSIIVFNDNMIHVDALVDIEDAAEKLHEIIEKLLTKNNGYVSSAQLFDYVRVEMQMFLNDNDVFNEQKVFGIVKYLFGKIHWHGYGYEFSSGRHISRCGKEAIRTNMDVFVKFAREQGGVFRWDDLLRYLDRVGIKPNNLRVQMGIGSEPVFFYLSSDKLITVESMKIDDEWLALTKKLLQRLFEDVGDHIVIREISPYWYQQLPELPCRSLWTAILLQYVIKFYGKQLEARTIHSEMPLQYDTIHAVLVKDNSDLHTFGDAVVSYIVDNDIKERHFETEQLRRILIYGKLIGNSELIGNLPRAIGNDPRFAWDATGENVIVNL